MVYNYSRDSEYHSQRNNMVVPYSSCNTTSMVMALKQGKHELPPCGDAQPEDELSRLLRSPEAFVRQKQLAPWSLGAYPPQEVHACLEWGVNRWMGKTVDRFTTDALAADFVAALDGGAGVVLSGQFPMGAGYLGHIVSLAGYETDDRSGELINWIIDDPYGDWHTQYRNFQGNNIVFSRDEFKRIFRKGQTYWAHIVEGTHGHS